MDKQGAVARPRPADLLTDLDWLVAIGQILYGDRWQAGFAKMVGISPGHMGGMLSGRKPVSRRTKALVVAALERHREDIMQDAIYRVRMVGETIMRFSGK